MKPTARMKRLYHQLIHRWGEPDDLIIFDRSNAAVPGALEMIHVAIWDTDDDCDVTSFFTLGMSEATMTGTGYLAEVTLGCRAPLDSETRSKIPAFLANIAEYPFDHNLKLDWWERIANPGPIPAYPNCTQLLLAPDFGEGDFHWFLDPDSDVKVLRVVPITPRENQILKEQGREAFLDYWDEHAIDIYAPRKDPE